jgi:serine/threonine protein kinase
MASSELPPPEREQRFNDVLAEYLDALETGQPDDRAALLERHPDLADDLRAFFARAEQVQGLAAPLRATAAVGSSSADAAAGSAQRSFPRLPAELFRIVREVGRGGMGVVYEAVDLSLGRRVALKVLRGEDQADPRALERFRREARIVARLHHTNIVPIFQVGAFEGMHYFTMEFIEGRGLDRILHDLRQPPATANALADRTRPLTPPPTSAAPASGASGAKVQDSTAVPMSDGNGTLSHDRYRFVARLGVDVAEALAHAHEHGVLHRDIKPSNLLLDQQGAVWVTDFGLAKEGPDALTAPGEVVGTLRYLAPERFSGQIDERSEVYSLGATLYELLTLRPVHDESDRARLMARVLHEEPVRPRQLDRRMPRDLETIVLTALAKDPARRYPTARALADDLRRFLADAPIQARRAGVLERGWRWCRRNPGIASTSALATLALLIGLGVALWQWQRAEESARRAQAHASQANKDFELAFHAIDQMLERVGGDRLMFVPHMDQTRRALLQDAIRFYQDLLRGKEDHPEVRLATARAYCRLGQIHGWLNEFSEAIRDHDQALALIGDLLAGDPESVEHRRLAATIYSYRGAAHASSRRSAEAEADYCQALAAWQRLSAEQPEQIEFTFGLGYTSLLLAELLRSLARLEEAATRVREAIALAEKLPAGHPHRSWLLASGFRDLAVVLEENGALTESAQARRQALESFERAAQETPEPFSRHELAKAVQKLAQLQVRNAKTPAEAERLFVRALELSERLVADFPDVPLYRERLADTANDFGWLLRDRGRSPEAGLAFERSALHWKDLVAKFPDEARYRVGLGGAQHNLALVRAGRHDWAGARALLDEAIAHQEKALNINPQQAQLLEFLANHYVLLTDLLVKMGEPTAADQAVARQRDLAAALAEKDGNSVSVREFQARACTNLAVVRTQTARPQEAETTFREAAQLWRNLITDVGKKPSYASRLGAVLADRAVIFARQSRWAEMIPLLDEGIQAQESAVQARREERSYLDSLCKQHSLRADAHLGLGQHALVYAAATVLRERFPDRLDEVTWAGQLALCIPLAKKDAQLSQEQRDQLARQYADESMVLLDAAKKKNAKNLSQIHTHPAFRALHARADYQALLATVAKASKTAK